MAEPLLRSDEPSLVIGFGASAGGVEALRAALSDLPADLDAAVFVVLHVPASGKSLLAPILARVTRLHTDVAVAGERVAAGRVYVAPADHHLLVRDGRIVLSRGPKENGVRPAVDPMLRSLAQGYGPFSVAVILSGALGDGSAGAVTIARAGGVVIVQDPHEAVVPSMPESAQQAVGGRARVSPVGEIADLLTQAADERRGMREDVAMVPDPPGLEPEETPEGSPTSLTRPECGGPVEVLEERAKPLRRVAHHRTDVPRTRGRLEEGAADALRRSRLIRRALATAPEGIDAFELEAAGGG